MGNNMFFSLVNGEPTDDFAKEISRALHGNEMKSELDIDRYHELESVYEKFCLVFGKAKLKLKPGFASGSVSIDVNSVVLTDTEIEKLMEFLPKCSTFSVTSLADNTLHIAVTMKHIFKIG